jgi:hypothetical protein
LVSAEELAEQGIVEKRELLGGAHAPG